MEKKADDYWKKIRLIRLGKGLSQSSLATALDLSIGAVSNIETGKADITITRLNEIADFLETDIFSILEKVVDRKIVKEHNVQYSTISKHLDDLTNTVAANEELIEQQKQEIIYLKEIISLLKSDTVPTKKI